MKQIRKSGSAVKEKATDLIAARKKQLYAILGKPKILDEISFVVGLIVILLIEGVILKNPSMMPACYTLIGLPLLVVRYFLYRSKKQHYFLCDFCYYAQLLLLLSLWYYERSNEKLFWIVFSLCTGPLGGGVYMWKNSLVLHDLDRFTSTFIHLVPPLVVYCIRWHSYGQSFVPPGFSWFMWRSLALYSMWQAFYVLKTEVMDRKRFKNDKDLITSLRWLTCNRPHPVYRWVRAQSWGHNIPGLVIIVTVQFAYTVVTLAPCYLFMRYRIVNEAWIAWLFLSALWNGSRFYFEILAERERKKKTQDQTAAKDKSSSKVELKLSSTKTRFFTFMVFIILAVVSNHYLILLII